MAKDWKKKLLVKIADISKGDILPKDSLKSGTIPVVAGGLQPMGTHNISNRSKNVITVSSSGANAGFINFYDMEIFATDCLTIYIKDGDNKFLYYSLLKIQEKVNKLRVGGAQPHVYKKDLDELLIKYPPSLFEQQAIASALSSFDTHINNLTNLIEKKKLIRDGAVEELVSGKRRLDGFDGEWTYRNFDDVITPKARIGWQGLKKDEYLKKGYAALISGTDFCNGKISMKYISYVNEFRYRQDRNIMVFDGDVLVTKDGTIGKVAKVSNLNSPATLNSGVFVFKTSANLEKRYLYWLLMSEVFKRFIDELAAGSTIKHLYQKDLQRLKFYIPINLKEQQAIADILTTMDKEIEELEKEKIKYEQLKQGAMDDLLTGKIRLV